MYGCFVGGGVEWYVYGKIEIEWHRDTSLTKYPDY